MAPEFVIPNMGDVPNQWPTLDEHLVYDLRITECSMEKTKEESKYPGEPMIMVSMEVLGPPEWEGKSLFDRLLLPMNVLPTDTVRVRRQKLERGIRLRQYMEAFELKWSADGRFHTDEWIGAEARCEIRNREYEGQVRSEPRKYYKKSA